MTDWRERALELGFSEATPLDPKKLTPLPAVREMIFFAGGVGCGDDGFTAVFGGNGFRIIT